MALADEIESIAAAACAYADGLPPAAVLPAEPAAGARRYVCAYEAAGSRTWLVLDADGVPLRDRDAIREAVAIAGLCELAAEAAFGGDLDELGRQLEALRATEAPAGLDEAEAALHGLRRALGEPPALATPARVDGIGAAARRLELALDPTVPSPFAAAMQAGQGVLEALVREVEGSYRLPVG